MSEGRVFHYDKRFSSISWWERILLKFKACEFFIVKEGCVEWQATFKTLFGKRYMLGFGMLPPRHFNCRCVTLPVGSEEE